ncbi:MAG: DUF302 domain-containing protein [Deltaproteobacteria bacterium]|nr:MAG: DUF302 domain-containing protein [Deltaproteobacteria bacterium]
MFIEARTKKSPRQAGEALEKAAKERKFGVLHVHNVTETLTSKGLTFEREMYIYEVCNPFAAKKVLDTNPRISTAMPCRVSVYSDGDETVIVTMKPTVMLEMFNEPTLRNVAQEVEEVMGEMVREAARDE